MFLWRICKDRHAATALSGEGARIAGGRWNHRGTRLVYCSSSISLATLEVLVHVDIATVPSDLVVVKIEVPDSASMLRIPPPPLPANWRDHPPPDDLKDIGTTWARDAKTLGLIVPSAIVDEENVLLNPEHPEIAKVNIVSKASFAFDPRLFKKP